METTFKVTAHQDTHWSLREMKALCSLNKCEMLWGCHVITITNCPQMVFYLSPVSPGSSHYLKRKGNHNPTSQSVAFKVFVYLLLIFQYYFSLLSLFVTQLQDYMQWVHGNLFVLHYSDESRHSEA